MQPSPSARRFAFRLRITSPALISRTLVKHATSILTVTSLAFVFVGLAMPSAAFGVVGALLVLLTPIGAALRILIRGK